MQLKVTGMKSCDFVEAVFDSPYSKKSEAPSIMNPEFFGEILLVHDEEGHARYEYGDVNKVSFEPTLPITDTIIERIPWSLKEWHEQVVAQSEGWWLQAKPLIDAFWIDVERAKIDDSFLQEHLKKKEKEDKCLIRLVANDTPCSEEPVV